MKNVIVSKEDSWKLDTSMFCVEGNWETGYVLDTDIFFMVGVTSYYEEGASSVLGSLECEVARTIFHLQTTSQDGWWLKQASTWLESIQFNTLELGDNSKVLDHCNNVLRCLRNHYNGMR